MTSVDRWVYCSARNRDGTRCNNKVRTTSSGLSIYRRCAVHRRIAEQDSRRARRWALSFADECPAKEAPLAEPDQGISQILESPGARDSNPAEDDVGAGWHPPRPPKLLLLGETSSGSASGTLHLSVASRAILGDAIARARLTRGMSTDADPKVYCGNVVAATVVLDYRSGRVCGRCLRPLRWIVR
jgi:hypothetical protein